MSDRSIPIPDGLVRVATRLWSVGVAHPNDVRVVRVDDLPKLREAWVEAALDSSPDGALHRAGEAFWRGKNPHDDRNWSDLPDTLREIYLQDAADVVAAALGFEVTPDGLVALRLREQS